LSQPPVRLEVAKKLMEDYAHSTGLLSGVPQRYLWTDAFAVLNFLELHRLTLEQSFKEAALRLIDQVHHVLGRHRGDDGRSGWISGLEGEEAERHPTARGLRIGKRLPERRPGEPYDPVLEWERDGQYYHYLTKWMKALSKAAQSTGDPRYHGWAVELAKVAHSSFTYTSPVDGRKRIYWKMSIDLTRPLVPYEGQHDALDGLVTYAELQTASQRPCLDAEVAELLDMCMSKDWSEWVTDDPLGVGELLSLTYRAARLVKSGVGFLASLLPLMLEAAYVSLRAYLPRELLKLPASRRVAFRELGLSIGLRALEKLGALAEEDVVPRHRLLSEVHRFLPMREEIESFWLNPVNWEGEPWATHRHINQVMLAASLIPEGYLD